MNTMQPHEVEEYWKRFGEYMKDRAADKAAAEARTAALAGTRAAELVEAELEAEKIRQKMRGLINQSWSEGRTLDYEEQDQWAALEAQLEAVKATAKSIVRVPRG